MSTTELTDTWSQLVTRWHTKDIPGHPALLTEEVDVVNRGGQRFAGKRAFARQLDWLVNRGLPELFTAEHVLESSRLPQPGVALLHELRVESRRQPLTTYLLTERDGRWSVDSISIAPIDEPATQH